MPSPHARWRVFPCVIAVLLALAIPAVAEDAPKGDPATIDEGLEAADSRGIPAVSPVPKALPRVAPVRRPIEGVAGDKGSTFTDGAFGAHAPALPTVHELMKLQRARELRERSRAAGTLYGVVRPSPHLEFTQQELEFQKMRALDAMARQKRIPAGDPIASPGAVRAIQKHGPAGLSELEQRKLEAFLNGIEFTGPPPAKALQPREEQPKIDEGRKVEKEGS